MNILLAILFIVFPAPIIWLNNRVKFVERIGIVIICYALGMVVGNIGVIPESFSGIQTTIQDISVCLALPLILFSVDIKQWKKTAKKGLICMGLAVVSILITVFVLHMIFRGSNPNVADYGALAIGVYTGGTVNVASIAAATKIPENSYMMFNTVDMVVSTAYMIFLTSVGRKFFQKVFRLPAFQGNKNVEGVEVEDDNSFKGMAKPQVAGKLVLAFLLSAVIVGVSYIAGTLVKGSETAVTILLITTLSLACSFIKPIREIKKTRSLGMYIIYIFCFTVATMADFSEFTEHFDYTLLVYITVSIFGNMFLHAILCKFAKIDSDTMIVTSVSAICSPPFVPVVAASLNNNAVLISGLTTGIIGYAIGNYLGVLMHFILNNLPF
jgi:uncharacterized membrane protein